MKLVVPCLLLLMLVGCATTYRQNTIGLSGDAIAILEHHKNTTGPDVISGGSLLIEEVDGKWRGIGNFERYELLPGEHTLTVAYFDGFFMGTSKLLVKFTAISGKTYALKKSSEGMRWTAAVVDADSGLVVSQTTKK